MRHPHPALTTPPSGAKRNMAERTVHPPVKVGDKFGRLEVIAPAERKATPSGALKPRWLCRCECGTEKEISGEALLKGATRSCRCLQREGVAERATTHGMSRSLTYHSWRCMLARCHNPKNHGYQRYGGRGIIVCGRWRFGENGKSPFSCFVEDMGERPTKAHTIDRKDSATGQYDPSSCRWATHQQQQRNRRSNRRLVYNEMELTIIEWAEHTGLNGSAIAQRIDRMGWTVGQSLGLEPPPNTVMGRPPRRTITCNGVTDTIPGWSARTGVPQHRIRQRLKQKWPAERALGFVPKLRCRRGGSPEFHG